MLRDLPDPLRGFALPGSNATVSLGWLESPDEFAASCLHLVQRPVYDSWAICAQLPDATVRVLQSRLVPNAGGIVMLESVAGVIYPVVLLQSGGVQLRLMLCLSNDRTTNWLRSVASQGRVNIAIEIPDVSQRAVIGLPCDLRDGQKVEELINSSAIPDWDAAVQDAAKSARTLTATDALPSILEGFSVQELKVVVALEHGFGNSAGAEDAAERILN